MLFSDVQFAAAWTVLEDRFGRKHNAQTVKIYRDILQVELTAEQFSEACRAAFRMETFFPSPQKLIDYGTGAGDFTLRALAAWDEAIERVTRGLPATDAPGPVRTLLRGACNGEQLGMIDTKSLQFVKKEFVSRYGQHLVEEAKRATPALAAPEVSRVLQ